nr:CASP-like protein PIMP1 [Ipomoea batatas]
MGLACFPCAWEHRKTCGVPRRSRVTRSLTSLGGPSESTFRQPLTPPIKAHPVDDVCKYPILLHSTQLVMGTRFARMPNDNPIITNQNERVLPSKLLASKLFSLPSCRLPSCSPFQDVDFQDVLPSKLLASKLFSLPSCRVVSYLLATGAAASLAITQELKKQNYTIKTYKMGMNETYVEDDMDKFANKASVAARLCLIGFLFAATSSVFSSYALPKRA